LGKTEETNGDENQENLNTEFGEIASSETKYRGKNRGSRCRYKQSLFT
jgi:hypothetical protein